METTLTIKNFRVFDENGVSIEIKPITILTGCNSSGKSSVVKATLLLDSFLSQIKQRIENKEIIVGLGQHRLNFSSRLFKSLGNFNKIVHREGSNYEISFEYTVYSYMLSETISVFLSFGADDNDELNNGFLKSFRLSTDNGVFYEAEQGSMPFYNYNVIKEKSLAFIEIGDILRQYYQTVGKYFCENDISQEDYYESITNLKQALTKQDTNRVTDIKNFIRKHGGIDQIIGEGRLNNSIVEWTKQKGSLFMIPVITFLDTINKDEFSSVVEKLFFSSTSNEERLASRRIIKDFIQSEFEKFGDYFIFKETEWLGHIGPFQERIDFSLPSFSGEEGRVMLPNPNGMRIPQDYLLSYPYRYEHIKLSEEDKVMNEEEKKKDFEEWNNTPISFPMLYEITMGWNASHHGNTSTDFYYFEDPVNGFPSYNHIMFSILSRLLHRLVLEALSPEWVGNISYAPSSRVTVNRLYPLDIDDTFSNMLKSYFESKRRHASNYSDEKYQAGSFMNKWIQLFLGKGKSITLDIDKEGLGVQLRLHHTKDDIQGSLLADEGFGVTQLLALLVQIEIAILADGRGWTHNYVGLSDIYPENDKPIPKVPKTIAIEEPEIHLHPAFQSKLADMMVDAFIHHNIHFIIETHSEYLIRKLQLFVPGIGIDQNERVDREDISILYINANSRHSDNGLVKHIHICKDGYLDDVFGTGFYDEATILSRKLM